MRPRDAKEGGSKRARFISPVLGALVFLAVLVYLALVIEPRLIYSSFGIFQRYPQFQKDPAFLKAHLCLPGGIAEVATGWISQWYYHNWLGAAAISILLAALYLGMYRLVGMHNLRTRQHIAFLPVMVCLIMYGRYDHPTQFAVCLVITVWLTVLCLWVQAHIPWSILRAGLAGLVFAACYMIAGATAFIMAAFISTMEAVFRRRPLSGVVFLALAICLYGLIGLWLCAMEPLEALAKASPWDRGILPWLDQRGRWLSAGLYLSVLLGPYLSAGWLGLMSVTKRHVRERAYLARAADLAMIGMYLLSGMSFQCGTKYQLAINQAGMEGNWQTVLDLAAKVKARYRFTPASILEVNRALIHKGLLGEQLFCYPQDPRILALFTMEGVGKALQFAKRLEIHLDLGDLNAAEQDAYELLETQGPAPFVLWAIAKVHMAKGQYEAAKVALYNMTTMPGTRQLARLWLERLDDPARLDADEELARLRRFKRVKDEPVRDRLFDQILLEIIEEHPENRYALEYLMGYYLLTRQDEMVVANLHRLKTAGYQVLQRYYHQALLIYADRTRRPVGLPGLPMDAAVVDQFIAFNKAAKALRSDRATAARLLAAEFGDTYMYYYLFGISGVR